MFGIVHRDADPNAPGAMAGLDGAVTGSVAGNERPGASERFSTSFEVSERRFACGFGLSYRRFAISEANAQVVGSVALEGRAVLPQRWSPDGSVLLFAAWKLTSSPSHPGGECFEDGPPAWHTWSLNGIKEVPDLRALLRQWDGPRFVDLTCNGTPTPMEYPLNPASLQCDGGSNRAPATLVIGGKPIDQIRQAAVVGFID